MSEFDYNWVMPWSPVILFVAYWTFHMVKWYCLTFPRFDGKTIIITGASSGIGEEMAKQMSRLGAKKLILTARRVEELERVKKECLAQPGVKTQIEVEKMDLNDVAAC